MLAYEEENLDSGKSTIVLIHGATSSNEGYKPNRPYFSDTYHLILPDLPGHGKSKDIPFTRQTSAKLLAELIRSRARNGKAHIVGHSMGAHIAIELATTYPDVVDVVFVSGYGVGSSAALLGYGLWIQGVATRAIPAPVIRALTSGTDLPTSSTPNTLSLNRALADSMCFGPEGWPKPWPARTLIIAAGKSGILPTADNADQARKLRDIGRKANTTTIAFTHREMRHPWNAQAPKLYVDTIIQWIEAGRVSGEFELL